MSKAKVSQSHSKQSIKNISFFTWDSISRILCSFTVKKPHEDNFPVTVQTPCNVHCDKGISMNVTCIICSDMLLPSTDIYVVPCGHIFHYVCLIQWIERSKTCPQCRNRATERTMHRIYFNIANTDHIKDDVATLQNKLDETQISLKEKAREVYESGEKYNKIKNQCKELRKEVANLEAETKSYKSVMVELQEKVSYFKLKSKEVNKLTAQLFEMEKKLKDVESVQLAIEGTREQVNDMLRKEESTDSLALCVATLKKALLDSDKKKKESDFKYKQTRNDFTRFKKEITTLEISNKSLKRELEEAKKEKEFLKDKIKTLQDQGQARGNIERLIAESPIAYSRKPCGQINQDQSPAVGERVLEILDSTSPYLQIKTGTFNNYSSLRKNPEVTIPAVNKLTIFKSSVTQVNKTRTANSAVVYNGLGGHSKEDTFPSPKATIAGVKRPRSAVSTMPSSKFRKLGPAMFTKK